MVKPMQTQRCECIPVCVCVCVLGVGEGVSGKKKEGPQNVTWMSERFLGQGHRKPLTERKKDRDSLGKRVVRVH